MNHTIDIKEEFLHYVWKYKLYNFTSLRTTDGEPLEVISTGYHNTDAGPDFLTAKIRIGNILFAGNIEIHLTASDWYVHRHEQNPAYDNVILHVVLQHDKDILNPKGQKLPCLEIAPYLHSAAVEKYLQLMKSKRRIPCEALLKDNVPGDISFWLERLVVERLVKKSDQILAVLEANKNDWSTTAYIIFTRYLGSGLNNDAFQELAEHTPLAFLQKNAFQPHVLSAILFGQAGFLEKETDSYSEQLRKEYLFQKQKFDLSPLHPGTWKFSRIRPSGFPTLRIAYLVSLIVSEKDFFRSLMACDSIEQVAELLEVPLPEYWQQHYHFGKKSTRRINTMGKGFMQNVVINVVAPLRFAYAHSLGEEEEKETAIDLLHQCEAEHNGIVDFWEEMGITVRDAAQSQALIEWRKNYCDKKKCLNCGLSRNLLA